MDLPGCLKNLIRQIFDIIIDHAFSIFRKLSLHSTQVLTVIPCYRGFLRMCASIATPARRSSARSIILSAVFRRRKCSVVRPTSVIPSNTPSLRTKCSLHACVRGLKSGVKRFVSGSKEAISLPFRRLHKVQESARLSAVVRPLCFSPTM